MSDSPLTIALWLFKFQIVFSATALLTLAFFKLTECRLSARVQRTVARAALVSGFLALVYGPLLPPMNVLKPAVQIAAESSGDDAIPRVTVRLAPLKGYQDRSDQTLFMNLLTATFLVSTAVVAVRRLCIISRDRKLLSSMILTAFQIREIGRVQIRISALCKTPFTGVHKGRAVILIPQNLLSDARRVRFIVQHELQHHRQGDLGWSALLVEVVRTFACGNPLLARWFDALEERDELACDEALLGRRGFDDHAYASCLLEVAKSAVARMSPNLEQGARLVGTARMAIAPQFLKRRIEMIVHDRRLQNSNWVSSWACRGIVALSASVMVGTVATLAWAGENLVSDHRVSQANALTMASRASARTGFPIVVNRRVLDFVNRATGTPRARFFMRNTLKRMKTYEPMIAAKLLAAQLPSGLLALPAMESGYQNTETATSAGLWQFVPQTARNYGLRVDDQQDERLDAEKETGAAIALLTHLTQLFGGDLNLALLGYNAGEQSVQKLIQETGTRDVFQWADQGRIVGENANYVPKFMAAVIILENPDLVKE